jgi:hypothetical protein
MKDLIEALQIFSKYGNPAFPTHCEHDTLYISAEISPYSMSFDDRVRVEKLGFFVSEEYGEPIFKSYKFGGC